MDNGLLKHGEQLAINPLLWPGRGRNSNSHSHDKGTWLLDPSAYDHTLAVAFEAHPTLGQSDGHAVYPGLLKKLLAHCLHEVGSSSQVRNQRGQGLVLSRKGCGAGLR